MTSRKFLSEMFLAEVVGPDGQDYVTAVVPKGTSMHGDISDLPQFAKDLGSDLSVKMSSLGAHITGPRNKVEEFLDACAILTQDVSWEDD